MKNILIASVYIIAFTQAIVAQESGGADDYYAGKRSNNEESQGNYLFDNLFDGLKSTSGIGGVMIDFYDVNGESAVSVGGGGAVLVNDRFYFGGYGTGVANSPKFSLEGNPDAIFKLGHGGLWMGAIIKPESLVHLALSSRFGWGGLTLEDGQEELLSENIFVVNPQLDIELNVARWLRLSVGAGYRLVSGIDSNLIEKSDFNGYNINLGFHFGWFEN